MIKKVLVVDDDSSIANIISDLAEMMGCKTKILQDGKEVLSVAKEWKPDVITLDIMMPPPDGVEVLSVLKNDPETKSIPVIIISVVSKKKGMSPHLSLADMVLEKPFDMAELNKNIRKLAKL